MTIVLTEEQAILASKIDCIRQFEKAESLCIVDETLMSADVWLQKSSSCHCACGETQAIRMILFAGQVPPSLLKETKKDFKDAELSFPKEQYYSLTGICDSCGKDID